MNTFTVNLIVTRDSGEVESYSRQIIFGDIAGVDVSAFDAEVAVKVFWAQFSSFTAEDWIVDLGTIRGIKIIQVIEDDDADD